MFAVVMSLPCVEVGVPIESLVKVIRLNGPGFNPVNVVRTSRKCPAQRAVRAAVFRWFGHESAPDMAATEGPFHIFKCRSTVMFDSRPATGAGVSIAMAVIAAAHSHSVHLLNDQAFSCRRNS